MGKAHGHHVGKAAAFSCLLIATLKDTHSFSKAGMVSFYALWVQIIFSAGQLSCDQEICFTKG